LDDLLKQQKEINRKINELVDGLFNKYGISEVLRNDNPYSRLMVLKKMGVVANY
jgi:hypothetical protein